MEAFAAIFGFFTFIIFCKNLSIFLSFPSYCTLFHFCQIHLQYVILLFVLREDLLCDVHICLRHCLCTSRWKQSHEKAANILDKDYSYCLYGTGFVFLLCFLDIYLTVWGYMGIYRLRFVSIL